MILLTSSGDPVRGKDAARALSDLHVFHAFIFDEQPLQIARVFQVSHGAEGYDEHLVVVVIAVVLNLVLHHADDLE